MGLRNWRKTSQTNTNTWNKHTDTEKEEKKGRAGKKKQIVRVSL